MTTGEMAMREVIRDLQSQLAACAAARDALKKENERLNLQYAEFVLWYARHMETCKTAKSAFQDALKDVCTRIAERSAEREE